MKSSMKSGVLVGVALLAAALVGVTVAEEPAKDTLQSSWNDYPAKWIHGPGNGPVDWGPGVDTVTPSPETETQPYEPEQDMPNGILRPYPIPNGPRQQQQGKPSGGFQWGGGKTGGSGYFGGKQGGGGFSWGKTKPPQSQQGVPPRPQGGQATPSQAQLIQYIQQLQKQNAELRELLQRLAGQQGADGERSPDMPSGGTPLY